MQQTCAVLVNYGQPFAPLLRDAGEDIVGMVDIDRIAAIDTFDNGNVRKLGEIEAGFRGHNHTASGALFNSHIGPPINRQRIIMGIDDPDSGEEELGVIGKMQIDLEGEALDAVPSVESQGRFAVDAVNTSCVEGLHGKIVVAQLGGVPFDAAVDPSIAQGYIARLKDAVLGDELLAGWTVHNLGY